MSPEGMIPGCGSKFKSWGKPQMVFVSIQGPQICVYLRTQVRKVIILLVTSFGFFRLFLVFLVFIIKQADA